MDRIYYNQIQLIFSTIIYFIVLLVTRCMYLASCRDCVHLQGWEYHPTGTFTFPSSSKAPHATSNISLQIHSVKENKGHCGHQLGCKIDPRGVLVLEKGLPQPSFITLYLHTPSYISKKSFSSLECTGTPSSRKIGHPVAIQAHL